MRKVLYAVILFLLYLAPVKRVDVAKLLPIRAVAIYQDGDVTVMETDTGHKGTGEDALEALSALKNNTPAVVYLDTAEFLLVSEESTEYVDQLREVLKPSVKVCVCRVPGKVADAADYLGVHGVSTQLRHWRTK